MPNPKKEQEAQDQNNYPEDEGRDIRDYEPDREGFLP